MIQHIKLNVRSDNMCNYCKEDFDGYRSQFKGGSYISWSCLHGWHLVINGKNNFINYCPMCGERLSDKNV